MLSPDMFGDRSIFRRVGFYMLLFVAVGIGGGSLVYTSIMQSLGWPVQGGSNAFSFLGTRNAPSLVLYLAPNSQKYFSSVGANYQVLLEPWRAYAKSRGLTLREINSLGADGPDPGSVLVLASAVALDASERASLARYKSKGGSLLITWATGSRDERGEWMGWDFIQSTGDARVVADLPKDGSLNNLITRGQMPLTHSLPAGFRLWLGKPAETPILLSSGEVAAHAMNWARIAPTSELQRGLLTFKESANGDRPGSRVAVLGVAESSWEYQLADMHTLLDGVVGWLARQPTVLQADWPNAVSSAYFIAMDTEEKFENAEKLASLFNLANYRGTFFFLTSEAKKHPDLIRAIDARHDIGYHGDIHTGFKDVAPDLQKKRVSNMIQELNSILNQSGVHPGFRAPTESYDQNTSQALFDAGIKYHLADPHSTAARLPFFAAVNGQKADKKLVTLPRTQRDDFNLMQDTQGDLARLEQGLLDDFKFSVAHGGFGVLSVHSQQFETGMPFRYAIPSLMAQVRNYSKQVWFASGSEIAQWWLDKEKFRLNVRQLGTRVEVDITVLGDVPYERGALIVILPDKATLPQVNGLKPGMPTPRVERLDDYRAVIRFDALSAGSYGYSLTF